MEPALWVGPAIVAAIIAGLISVAGWFVTFRQARRIEQERRAEKVIDIQTALLAEIRSDLHNLEDFNLAEKLAVLRDNLERAAGPSPYTPFVPKDSGAPIFLAIIGQISVLPTRTIGPVVLYYKQRETIAHFTDDLRASSFSALPPDRKLAMMKDYLLLKAHAAALARDVVSALEGSLGLPASINRTAAGPSVLKSASERADAARDEEQRSA